jgi:hypothetical protein
MFFYVLNFSFSRTFAPKESTILRTKLYPTRIGVSRLYVTFVSADVCSLTQSIPLEIIAEPIKERDKPLLKNNTETSTTTEKKSEIKIEDKENVSPTNPSDNQDQLSTKPKEEISSVVEGEKSEKKSPEIKLESPPIDDKNGDDDYGEELYFKKNQSHLHPNTGITPSATHGSTSSLDKDRMSIDSLDISSDRRHLSNNNIHYQ